MLKTTKLQIVEVLSPKGVFYGFEITAGDKLYMLRADDDMIKHNGITPDIDEELTRITVFSTSKKQ